MTTKPNGDPLEGTLSLPGTYPPPESVAQHPIDWAYGNANKTIDFTAPTAPVLSLGSKTTTTVVLNWTASFDAGSGVAGYDVYQGGSKISSLAAVTLTKTVTGLTTATAYAFVVKARDGVGNLGVSNTLNVTTS